MKRRGFAIFAAVVFALSGAFGAETASADSSQASARALLARAEEKRFAEDWYGAVEDYLAAVARNPSYAEALEGLAECYYEVGEYDEALTYAKKTAPFKRGDASLQNLEGFIRIGLSDLAGARKLFEGVAATRPNDLDARFGLALLDLAAGKKTDARSKLEESLRVSPQNARALLSLALIADDQGRRPEAQALIDRALRYHGEEPRVQFTAARLARAAGDREQAIFYARNALKASPSYAEARRLLASLMYESASYEEAISLMREAVARNRKDCLSWFTLGLASQAAGRRTDAIYAFRQIVAQRPDDEVARIALEDAVMDGAPLEDPSREEYADWHFSRGAEFEDRNYSEQALFEYRRGLKVYPYSKKGRVLYANLLRRRGLPGAQLSELRLLKELGKADTAVLDSIETYENLLGDSVSSTWRVDQYALPKRPYKLAVFYIEGSGEEYHGSSTPLLARYLSELLSSTSRLSVLSLSPKVGSSTEAFRKAREAGADYYLVVTVRETERDIELDGELKVGRTGSLATRFNSYRSGNDRVKDAASRLDELLVSSLAPRGSLLKRNADRGLVDLGKSDGFKAGDKLLVLRGSGLAVAPNGLGPSYPQDAVVGSFTITRVDEELSEGKLASADFFDRVNVGDEVLLSPPSDKSASKKTPPRESRPAGSAWSGLFTAIRALR